MDKKALNYINSTNNITINTITTYDNTTYNYDINYNIYDITSIDNTPTSEKTTPVLLTNEKLTLQKEIEKYSQIVKDHQKGKKIHFLGDEYVQKTIIPYISKLKSELQK